MTSEPGMLFRTDEERSGPKRKRDARTLIVYGTVEKDEFRSWGEAFESRFPDITIDYRREYVYGSPPPMAKRIMEEMESGAETADVVIASVPPLLQMQELNLLSSYKSPESDFYSPELVQKDGFWNSIISLPTVQIYNTDLLDKEELPTSVFDLTDPRWKDGIAVHDVNLGTFGSAWLASLKPVLGLEPWARFVDGLSKNKPKRFALFDDLVDSVANGDVKIGLTALLHDLIKAKDAKRPLDRLRLKEVPMLTTSNAIAIVRGGKHPTSAEFLIDFLLSREGQQIIGGTYVRIPARGDLGSLYSMAGVAPDEEAIFFPTPESWSSLNKDLELFRKSFS